MRGGLGHAEAAAAAAGPAARVLPAAGPHPCGAAWQCGAAASGQLPGRKSGRVGLGRMHGCRRLCSQLGPAFQPLADPVHAGHGWCHAIVCMRAACCHACMHAWVLPSEGPACRHATGHAAICMHACCRSRMHVPGNVLNAFINLRERSCNHACMLL